MGTSIRNRDFTRLAGGLPAEVGWNPIITNLSPFCWQYYIYIYVYIYICIIIIINNNNIYIILLYYTEHSLPIASHQPVQLLVYSVPNPAGHLWFLFGDIWRWMLTSLMIHARFSISSGNLTTFHINLTVCELENHPFKREIIIYFYGQFSMFKFTGGYSIILNLWITKVVAELSQTHIRVKIINRRKIFHTCYFSTKNRSIWIVNPTQLYYIISFVSHHCIVSSNFISVMVEDEKHRIDLGSTSLAQVVFGNSTAMIIASQFAMTLLRMTLFSGENGWTSWEN